MRKLAIGLIACAAAGALVSVALGAAGKLDRSFSRDGWRTTNFLGHNDRGFDVAVQDNGRVVVAGLTRLRGSEHDFALTRYRRNGRPDRSFSSDGKLHTALTGVGDEWAASVAIQGNDRIVAAGLSSGDFALTRYRRDGRLDDSFSGDGKLRTDFGGDDAAMDVAVARSGRIIAVGTTTTGTNDDVAVAVYDRRGRPIRQFTSAGQGSVDLGAGSALVPRQNGAILVAANAEDAGGSVMAVARFSAAGVLDPGFGDGGIATVDIPDRPLDQVAAMEFGDGRIVLGGRSGGNFAFARLEAGGNVDPSFSNDGRTTIDVRGFDFVLDLVLQDNGRAVAVGGAGTKAAVVRLKRNGGLDRTFGRNGHSLLRRPGPRREFSGVALQSDGRIVAAGHKGNGDEADFLVARFRR